MKNLSVILLVAGSFSSFSQQSSNEINNILRILQNDSTKSIISNIENQALGNMFFRFKGIVSNGVTLKTDQLQVSHLKYLYNLIFDLRTAKDGKIIKQYCKLAIEDSYLFPILTPEQNIGKIDLSGEISCR